MEEILLLLGVLLEARELVHSSRLPGTSQTRSQAQPMHCQYVPRPCTPLLTSQRHIWSMHQPWMPSILTLISRFKIPAYILKRQPCPTVLSNYITRMSWYSRHSQRLASRCNLSGMFMRLL